MCHFGSLVSLHPILCALAALKYKLYSYGFSKDVSDTARFKTLNKFQLGTVEVKF